MSATTIPSSGTAKRIASRNRSARASSVPQTSARTSCMRSASPSIDRSRTASAIAGDGGFLYAPGELATVAQERIPLTLVIVDDGGYGMLRYDQDSSGADRYGVDLVTPDFCALVGAFGIRAQHVDGLEDDFGAALAEHVLDPEPSVLVASTPEPLVPPPNTSPNWYRRTDGA